MARASLLLSAEEDRRHRLLRIERRRLRDISDPLQLPEDEFIANFRLNKAGYQQVYQELVPHLPVTRRKTGVRNELKILAVLNFYANGSYQRNIGASYITNMSQPTFSKCLHEVTDALNAREILLKYIEFPSSRRKREIIMRDFMNKYGFPGVVGCIDGTHVAIVRPLEHEECFFNRKNYHSINVLIICDSHLNILHVDASFGGACHDSFVWNQCPLKSYVERLHSNGEHFWLLGDSGYAQRPWMMTPILSATSGSPEEHYTDLHCRVKSTVERCIGVLKTRWRCLLAHRVLHYDPITAAKIVNACVVLHNVANSYRIPIPELQSHDAVSDQLNQVISTAARIEAIPDPSRDLLVRRLWNAI